MKKTRSLAFLFCLSLPIFYLFWLVFVGTFAFHELLLGAIGALMASVGLTIIDFYYPTRFLPTPAELLSFWRLPWYLLVGTWEIAVVAGKDLLRIERAKSLFRVAHFNAGKYEDASDVARRVLAVVFTTFTPNFIMLGVNTSDNKLLVHQIDRYSQLKLPKEIAKDERLGTSE